MWNRLGGWQLIGVMLVVTWTLAAVVSGWMYLPRAHQIPHDPQFLNKLSEDAAAILRGSGAAPKPGSGEPVWSDHPRFMRMANGAQLAFPAITTDERAELVASEYRELLHEEAIGQRGPFLLTMLAVWLAPLLLAGMAAGLISNSESIRGVFGNGRNKSRGGPTPV